MLSRIVCALQVRLTLQLLSVGTGPLAGIPISLKDSINVGGFDSSVGYSGFTGKPQSKDGSMVRLLKDAG